MTEEPAELDLEIDENATEELRKVLGPELIVVTAGYITALSSSEYDDE